MKKPATRKAADSQRWWHTLLSGLAIPVLVLAGCGTSESDELTLPSPTDTPSISATDTSQAEATVGDIAAENQKPGSALWRKGQRRATDVTQTAAYADRSSIFPGDPVTLFVSTQSKKWHVEAFRVGAYGGKGARLVWSSPKQRGSVQDAVGYVAATRTHFAKWQPSMGLDTVDWQPGMYLIRIVGNSGQDWLVPLVVRSADVTNRLVLVMSDLTWQAYNTWGGRSAYEGLDGTRPDRSRAVSFARPYENGNGTGKYLAYEHPMVQLAEAEGLPVSYVASSDLTDEPEALLGAAGVVFGGHDEYWTVSQRAHVTAARNAGVDLAFLGANTMYWRVRYSQNGPQGLPLETIYKSADEDPVSGEESTARFRDAPNPAPERALVGQEYECYPATGTYTVTDPKFFAFAGTGVKKGGTVPAILDVEVDRAYPGRPTPKNLQIVSYSPTDCAGSPTVSTSTYYTHKSGAGVFSTGTMGWVLRGLRAEKGTPEREFTSVVTLNVLRTMAAGQMGATYPSESNIKDFDLPRFNTTGAA